MPDQTPEEIALFFKTALPIDSIDEVMLPGSPFGGYNMTPSGLERKRGKGQRRKVM